jgi:hypothetical protein
MFGKYRLNREAECGVALTRSLEKIQRAIVAALQKREQSDVSFDTCKSHVMLRCFCLLESLLENLFGRFELVQLRVSVSETVVHRR